MFGKWMKNINLKITKEDLKKMKKKGKHSKHLRWGRIFILFMIIALIISLVVLTYKFNKNNDKIEEMGSQSENLTKYIEEKDLTIDNLTKEVENKTNEINSLNEKVTDLETEVERLKKKTSTTSRGSISRTETVKAEESSDTSTEGYIAFIATGYCPCSQCCGKNTGTTASGTKATAGRTVAMPSSYAFGTKIEIKGMGTYIVEDRGGAIKGNKIDIFFNTHQEALSFGRRTIYLKVL